MRRFTRTIAVVVALAWSPAFAQQPPAPDPAFVAAKQAFEALSPDDQRAVQDALVWTGDYNGTVGSVFGPRTRDAIAAFAARSQRPPDGTLDAAGRIALLRTATLARAAVGFATQIEPRSGARFGVPARLLTKRTDLPNGARFASTDGAITLDTSAAPERAGDLPTLFAAQIADQPGRKVTYKLLRPDFFVVSGDSGPKTFYTRFARGLGPDGTALVRGYTLTSPKNAKPPFDPVAIAIANAFEPFPAAAPAQGTPAVASAPAAAPPAPPPTGPVLAGTVLALGGGRAVAIWSEGSCGAPLVEGRPATPVSRDAATGVTLLQTQGAAGWTGPATEPQPGPVLVVSQALRGDAGRAALPATDVQIGAGTLSLAADGSARVLAPVQGPAGGAVVVSRGGALLGVLASAPSPTRISGVVPQTNYRLIPSTALNGVRMNAVGPPTQPEISAASLSAAVQRSVLPLFCRT